MRKWLVFLWACAALTAAGARSPENVQVQSSETGIDFQVRWSDNARKQSVTFYLLLPPKMSVEVEILDYRLSLPEHPEIAYTRSDVTSASLLSENRTLVSRVKAQNKGEVRFWQLMEVEVYPGPVQLKTKGGLFLESLEGRLAFRKPFQPASLLPEFSNRDWGYGLILEHLVANAEAMPLYAHRRLATPGIADSHSFWRPFEQGPGLWAKMLIADEGMRFIGPEHLHALDVDTQKVDPREIRLYRDGKPVPLHLYPGDAEAMTTGTRLFFYGMGSDSPYSTEKAHWFWLPESPTPPTWMAVEKPPSPYPSGEPGNVATSTTLRVEEDEELVIEHGNFLAIKGSAWVWHEITGEEMDFGFSLPWLDERASEPISIDLHFHLLSYQQNVSPMLETAPPLMVQVNDAPPQTLKRLANLTETKRTIEVSPKHLRQKNNVLRLFSGAPLQPEDTQAQIYFDYFEVHYPRNLAPVEGQLEVHTGGGSPWYRTFGFPLDGLLLFDVTHPLKPRVLASQPLQPPVHGFYAEGAGRTIQAWNAEAVPAAPVPEPAAPTSIHSKENEADYLIIYHPLFEEAVEQLAALQQRKGLRVTRVKIGDIFQVFSKGESTPVAIKSFLQYCIREWKTPPQYVCLFGDASSDYRENLRSGVENFVPAYTYEASGNSWASENWYACLMGEDLLPDILLGRISPQTPEDAQEMVRKQVAYTEAAPFGPWRARLGFCADDSGFRKSTRNLMYEHRPDAFEPQALWLEEYTLEDNFYLPKELVRQKDLKVSTEATLRLLDMFNEGLAFMLFMGHGSPNIWTDERIWFGGDSPNSDNLNLRNGDRLPFLATFTCNQGAFDYPVPRWHICISEDMMRVKKGGAVALFVPTGPGFTTVHEKLGRALLDVMFRDKLRKIGELTVLTRIRYLVAGGQEDMARMYVLLGDPALELAIPRTAKDAYLAPNPFSLVPGKSEQPVSFSALPDFETTGTFTCLLTDPQGNRVRASKPTPFPGERFSWTFYLPENAPPGDWHVRAYFKEKGSDRDGIAHATLHVRRPGLQIGAFSAVKEKTSLKASLVLSNPGDLDARGVEVRMGLTTHDGMKMQDPNLQILDLPAGTSQTLTAQWQQPTEPYLLKAEIPPFWMLPTDDALSAQPNVAFAKPRQETRPLPKENSGADLAFVQGTARFLRGNIVEGETVFLQFQMENQGSDVTRPFWIKAAAFEDGKRTTLRSKPEYPQYKQPQLGGKQKRWVTLRWDYAAYSDQAGESNIEIELDSTNQVKETNESNNTLQMPLTILSRPDVQVLDEKRETRLLPDGRVQITYHVTLRNEGEAEAVNRRLGFFRKQPRKPSDFQNPDFLVEELELDTIPGKTSQEFSHSWEQEANEKEEPTARVYQTLKTIRAFREEQKVEHYDW